MIKRLEGRIALVTGATRGIGAAVALRYAAEGAHVIAVGRTQGALEDLDDQIRLLGAEATLVPQDLTDYDAIDRLAAAIHGRWHKLDILVGNAGALHSLRPLGHYTPAIWDEVMNINLTTNWRLIRAFEPLLRASDAGRGVFVTSGITSRPRAYWGPYAASKAALEAMVIGYAEEIGNTAMRMNIVDPGRVATRMRNLAFPGEDPKTLPQPRDVTEAFVALAEPGFTGNGQIVKTADYAAPANPLAPRGRGLG